MLILCILRHDQTLDPDVPFGKRPARNRNQMVRGGAISAYGWLSPTSQKSQIINSRSSGYRLMLSRDRRRSGAIALPVVAPPSFPPATEEALNPHSPDGTVLRCNGSDYRIGYNMLSGIERGSDGGPSG